MYWPSRFQATAFTQTEEPEPEEVEDPDELEYEIRPESGEPIELILKPFDMQTHLDRIHRQRLRLSRRRIKNCSSRLRDQERL